MNQPFLCTKDDAALADALHPLLTDAALRRQVGDANRAKAERQFDQRVMFRSYGEVLGAPPVQQPAGRWLSLIAP